MGTKQPTLPPAGNTAVPSAPPTPAPQAQHISHIIGMKRIPNVVPYVVEYQPPTNIVEKVTTRFTDREAAIELAHGKIDEGLWVRCFIEGGE